MLVKLKPNAVLDEYFRKKDTLLYAIELPENDSVIRDHVTSWRSYGEKHNRNLYAKELEAGKCYVIRPKNPSDRTSVNIGIPIPESLLEVVDANDRGVRMRQVAPSTGISIQALRTFHDLGRELYVVANNTNYESGAWTILEGEFARQQMSRDSLAPWKDEWENPYEPVIGLLKSSGGMIPRGAVGYYVPMQQDNSSKKLFLDCGSYSGIAVATEIVQLAKDEKEALIFSRKMQLPFKLELSDDMRAIVESLYDSSGYAQLIIPYLNGDLTNHNPFQISNTAPNYWAVNKADITQVSFLPQSRLAGVLEKGQDPWDNPSRQTTTWAKLYKSFLNQIEFSSNSEYERISTQAVAIATEALAPEESKPEMLLVSGKDIGKYYQGSRYYESKGELGSSCMRAKSEGFFSMYNDNPNQISLLIVKDRKLDKIHGRALVWTMADGRRFIDRRYGTTPAIQTRMLNWALKQGMTNIWGGRQYEKGEGDCSVILENPYHAKYPYMDSMCYLNPMTGELTNKPNKGIRYAGVKDTQGGREHIPGETTCAVSNIVAPKEVQVQTVSKKYAFKKYVAELRTGRYELMEHCRPDELEGGKISITEAIDVYVKLPKNPDGKVQKVETKVTSMSNPGIAQIVADGSFATKDQLVISPLDGGFIKKSDAVLQADGGYCLPQTVTKYQALLAKKMPNKAMRLPVEVTRQEAVLA